MCTATVLYRGWLLLCDLAADEE